MINNKQLIFLIHYAHFFHPPVPASEVPVATAVDEDGPANPDAVMPMSSPVLHGLLVVLHDQPWSVLCDQTPTRQHDSAESTLNAPWGSGTDLG
jgi:hypothetical protein